jgi:hypothetical protein
VVISDGNRDDNDNNHQRPDATVTTTCQQHVQPEPGIRYT